MQVQGYAWRFQNMQFTQFYGGIIEALPNFGAGPFPWSPDTFTYKTSISLKAAFLWSLITAEAALSGVNVYGGESFWTRGPFMFAPSGGPWVRPSMACSLNASAPTPERIRDTQGR